MVAPASKNNNENPDATMETNGPGAKNVYNRPDTNKMVILTLFLNEKVDWIF